MLLEEIGTLEKLILEIANILGAKKRSIKIETLLKESYSQLSYSKDEILNAIKELYRKKFLIEGLRLTKINVLNNKNRKEIYNYIIENPGTHNREIRKEFGLGAYETYRNLEYLQRFGLIRCKKYQNKTTYFTFNFDVELEQKILVLKNPVTKVVYEEIINNKKIRLADLERILEINHGQIRPHIMKLIEANLIESVIENNITYYAPIDYSRIDKKVIPL